MTDERGCPDGMYPLDSDYPEEVKDFAELKRFAEQNFTHDTHNIPLGWFFSSGPTTWDLDRKPKFELVIHMPRKGQNCSMYTYDFDRAEVQAWLDTWVREQIHHWFGWSE